MATGLKGEEGEGTALLGGLKGGSGGIGDAPPASKGEEKDFLRLPPMSTLAKGGVVGLDLLLLLGDGEEL